MRTTNEQGVRRAAALVAVPGALLTTLGAVSTPASAVEAPVATGDVSAMSCSHNHSDKDRIHSGYVTADWLHYRSGPHTSCGAYGQVPGGTKIYYHCYTTTNSGATWTWGRVAGTSKQGWFHDSYLSNHGSGERCY